MFVFGRRLKELRKQANLTQQELGKLVGVTKVSICCYENGTRTPTLDTLIDLADSLNISLNYLLGIDALAVDETDKTNNKANNTTFVSSSCDLVIRKSVNASSVYINELVEWNITVVNNGPNSAMDVVVNDNLPAGLKVISATPSV